MSDHYLVTARKWRPQRFDDVVGQDHITRTLKNAIAENRLAHAYLFTGQRGCGKTTVARILAKAVNCPNAKENGYEPCNNCDLCISITNGSAVDVAEIDGASNNSVDDVRSMRENVKFPPLVGKYRIVIIDEVHMLTSQAFNALLKTLEEPPQHLIFIFATTEVQKVIPTILSRVQRFDFRRMKVEEIVNRLRHIADTDGIEADNESLTVIAHKGDGSMRDAQSVFDQAVAFTDGKITIDKLRDALHLIDADFYFRVTDAISAADTSAAFSRASEIVERGYDVEEFIQGLLEHLRNLLTVVITGSAAQIEATKDITDRYTAAKNMFSEGDLLSLIRIGLRALEQLRYAPSPRIILETMLVEMTLLERAIDIRSLIDEIRALRNGAPIASTPTPSQPRPAAEKKNDVTSAPAAQGGAFEADKWDAFTAFLSEKSLSFRLVADDVTLVQSGGSVVTIGVTKSHTAETFARNNETFRKYAAEFFGLLFHLETKKIERHTAAPKQDAPSVHHDDGQLSELESALIEQFGAVRV